MKARSRSVVAFAMLLLPRLAEACPMCASQQPGGATRIVALGVMILLPFAIACVVFGVLRRTGRLSTGGVTTGGATTGRDPSGRAASAADSERAGGMRELRP